MFHGIWQATRAELNDLNQWLPDRAESTRQYKWFLSTVGSGELAVMSWPGCSWQDPRLTELAERLRAERVDSPAGRVPLFDEVLVGSEAMTQLQEPPLSLWPDEAAERLEGVLIGPDQTTTAIVAVLTPAAAVERDATIATLKRLASEVCDVPGEEIRLGGPAVTAWAITRQSQLGLAWMILASVVLSMTLAWIALGSFRLAGIVFTGASYCQGWSVALIYYAGGQMNAVLVMLPCLVQVLAVSASVHWIGYYREALGRHDLESAPEEMLRRGWLPGLLATGTTLVGLATLAMSEIDLVRQFGFYGSLGVGLSYAVLVLYLPSMLLVRPAPPPGTWPAVRLAGSTGRNNSMWEPVSAFVLRRHRGIVLGMFVVLAATAAGLGYLRPQVKVETLFPEKAQLLTDLEWLDETLGPSVPLEVLVRFGSQNTLEPADRLLLVEQVDEKLHALGSVGGSLTAATFVPVRPSGLFARNLWDVQVNRRLDQFRTAGLVIETPEEQLWRLSLRVAAPNGDDYGRLLADVRQAVEPILDQQREAGVAQLRATYTGIIPVLDHAQHQLLADFMGSFALGVVLIALAMIAWLRSLGGGLVVMLPNLLPIAVVFGILAWLGQGVDVASMMTATIALGIAVDDTVHYVVGFRRGLDEGLSVDESIRRTYRLCGTAMLQTTIICGLGMLVFVVSPFLPTARFSLLMACLLAVALVGDLVLLPALLKGPFGRFFRPPLDPLEEPCAARRAA
jgi:predicted RND superfamily exporter protein